MFHYLLLFFIIFFLYYDRKCNYCGFEHFTSKKIEITDLTTDKNIKQLKILNDQLGRPTRNYIKKNIYNIIKNLTYNITHIEVDNKDLKLNDKSNTGNIYYTYSFTAKKDTVYEGSLTIPFKGSINNFDLIIDETKVNGEYDQAINNFKKNNPQLGIKPKPVVIPPVVKPPVNIPPVNKPPVIKPPVK